MCIRSVKFNLNDAIFFYCFRATQPQILVRNAHEVGSERVTSSFVADTSRLKRARDVGMLSFCLFRHDALTDMQHGLGLRSYVDLSYQCYRAYALRRLDESNTIAFELCRLFFWFKSNLRTFFASDVHHDLS